MAENAPPPPLGFFQRPFPVPDEMPAQLRHGATPQTPAQHVSTLEATGRWTPLAPAVAAIEGPQTLGWALARWGMVLASRTADMVGFTFGRYDNAYVRAVMARERDRVLYERSHVPTEADLARKLAGDDGDVDDEARERMAYGNRHERDAMLTLLEGVPRLRARASTFVTTPRGRRPEDGARALFGCTPDALGELAPRVIAAAPVQLCIEHKCPYGARAPAPWRTEPYMRTPQRGGGKPYRFRPMENHAHYLVQHHQQMYVTDTRVTLYCGWTGTGTRVFRVRYQEPTWLRTVAFVHALLATGYGAPIPDELLQRAKALRDEYKAMTVLQNGVMQVYDAQNEPPAAAVLDPASGEVLWQSAYTCETVVGGPDPTHVPTPGPARAWPQIADERLPEQCFAARMREYDAAEQAARAMAEQRRATATTTTTTTTSAAPPTTPPRAAARQARAVETEHAAAKRARTTTTSTTTTTTTTAEPPLSPDLLAWTTPPSQRIMPRQQPRAAAATMDDDDDDTSDEEESNKDAGGGGGTSTGKRKGLGAQLGALSLSERACTVCGAPNARYATGANASTGTASARVRVCSLACAATAGGAV